MHSEGHNTEWTERYKEKSTEGKNKERKKEKRERNNQERKKRNIKEAGDRNNYRTVEQERMYIERKQELKRDKEIIKKEKKWGKRKREK